MKTTKFQSFFEKFRWSANEEYWPDFFLYLWKNDSIRNFCNQLFLNKNTFGQTIRPEKTPLTQTTNITKRYIRITRKTSSYISSQDLIVNALLTRISTTLPRWSRKRATQKEQGR